MSVEATFESVGAGYGESAPKPWWLRDLPRRMVLVVLGLAPLLTPVFAPRDDGPFIYPYCAMMQLVGAWFCWQAARRYPGEKIRWRTVILAQCMHSVAYAVASVHNLHWFPYAAAAWLANACMAVCWVLFLPALMGIRAVRGKWVRTLDYLLAAMTAALITRAMGSGVLAGDGMSRVMVVLLTLVFLTVGAFVARLASTRREIKLFSSVMSMYLAACLVTAFLLNIVNLYWLGNSQVLASDMLIALPQLLLCEWSMGWHRLPVSGRRELDPALVDSFQPAITAIGGVLLALFGFRTQPVLAAAGVVMIVLCYALRTQLFYHRLFVQQKQLRKRASHMEELATRDALTGVGNRRWFDEEAEKLLAAWRSYPCSLVLVDTDKFKEVNDTFGHPLGDEVLREVAAALSEVTAQVPLGLCARIGGDEFGAVWPATGAAEALALAELVRAKVEAREFEVPFRATLSLGIATTQETLPLMKLMRCSDAALYRAKMEGRNAVRGIDLGGLQQDPVGEGDAG